MVNVLSIDVEAWLHILDSHASPDIKQWPDLECRIEDSPERMPAMVESFSSKEHLLFLLGWAAERHKRLVHRCYEAGREIASHGYGHVLAHKVSKDGFKDDIE